MSVIHTGAFVPIVIAATFPKLVVGAAQRNLTLHKKPPSPPLAN